VGKGKSNFQKKEDVFSPHLQTGERSISGKLEWKEENPTFNGRRGEKEGKSVFGDDWNRLRRWKEPVILSLHHHHQREETSSLNSWRLLRVVFPLEEITKVFFGGGGDPVRGRRSFSFCLSRALTSSACHADCWKGLSERRISSKEELTCRYFSLFLRMTSIF